MISCGFNGRLGNNLFQIANVISVSKKLGTDFILPEQSYCGHRGARNVDLSIFEYDFKRGIMENPEVEYNEKSFHYNPVPLHDNMRMSGFYQSWKYFEDVRDELLNKYFIPNEEIRKGLNNYIFNSQGLPTLGISVRRGDYLMLQHNHPVLSVDYYQDALNNLSMQTDFEFIYVFSDDIEYCKTIFEGLPVNYVQDDIGTQLFLMSKMNHLILSNSTFAWWGAYLNQMNGVVIAPDPWFGPALKDHNTKDLFLPNWKIQTHEIIQHPYQMSEKFFD